MTTNSILKPLLFGALLVPFTSANAAFNLIEAFDGLTPGALDTQNGWTSGAEYTVVADPSGGGGQVLQYTAGAQSGAFKPVGASAIPDGATGTLFARFRFETTANANFGFAESAAPSAYGDFRVQINRQNGTPIKGRDGGGFQDLSPLADNAGTWYNLWVVADNGTDTSRVFIQSDDDAAFATQTEVAPPDGTLNFRVPADGPLGTLYLRSQEGTAYFDDFYVSAGSDLSNPTIPEPSAALFSLLGASFLLRRRRG